MSETTNLRLFKHNEPLETNENQFDVDLALNQNWDKIDDAYGNLNTDIENLQTNDSKQDSLISKLKNAALNAETEEAKSLHVTDANKFGQLEVLGNHEQKIREGYNILDYLDYILTSKNNLTIKKDEETGYITVDGTPNADYTVILSETINITDLLEDKQTYTIFQENHSDNLDEKIYLQVTISDKDGSNPQYLNSSNKNRSFEVDKSLKQYHVKIQTGTITQAGTFTNYKNRFMIYKGTEEKEFELYGASPSTDYPSPVVCLGSNADGSFKGSTKISKINKNIYDIAKYPFTNRIAYNSSGGQVFWDGYCGILDYFPVKENTQYTFSNNLGQPFSYGLVFYNKDKEVISVETTHPATFTTPENCKYIRFAIYSNTLPTWVQIEVGNTATSYIEHKQTDYLLYIQQEMLQGDYFIKEANGWKEVHNYPRKIFDGTENWRMLSTNEENAVFCNLTNTIIYDYASDYDAQLSTHFVWNGRISGYQNALNSGIGISTYIENNNKYVYFVVPLSIASTVEEWKAWLAEQEEIGKPLTNYYKSAPPTKLPCTEAQSAVLEELNNLDLFEGVNNIITAEDIALLKLKYALDVKTYVDNQLANVNSQILNIAGGN